MVEILILRRWCGPCKILEPRLNDVVAGANNKVHLAKVDVDELDGLALKYEVSRLFFFFWLPFECKQTITNGLNKHKKLFDLS